MKNYSKFASFLVIVGIALNASVPLTIFAVAPVNYSININEPVSISGTTVNISGVASANNYVGQKSQQHVSIWWSNTDLGGASGVDMVVPDSAFTGNGFSWNWNSSHNYTPGTYTITVKICHQSCTGAEGSGDSVDTSIVVVPPPPTTGSLLVKKIAVNSDSTFNFSGTGFSNFNITTVNGLGEKLLEGLVAGFYSVTEDVLGNGWTKTGDTCQNVQVVAGQTSECTVTNTYIAPVFGCTDPAATNYNPNATLDNGSCTYPIPGCTNPSALNYNPSATVDDGSCEFLPEPVPGCTDPLALNYNPNAKEDDGSCTYPVLGCTNPNALNYNPLATPNNVDADNCEFPPAPVFGCTDPNATNYNPLATNDDQSCTYPPTECEEGYHLEGETCVPNETTPNNTSNGGGNGGGGGGSLSGGRRHDVSGLFGSGEVLGASVGPDGEGLMCEPYLKEYVKLGAQNDPEEVKKLQIFLNQFFEVQNPVTGVYGPITFEMVKKFQAHQEVAILTPWAIAGFPTDGPTGYVYKTTKRWINILKCPEMITTTPIPPLP